MAVSNYLRECIDRVVELELDGRMDADDSFFPSDRIMDMQDTPAASEGDERNNIVCACRWQKN